VNAARLSLVAQSLLAAASACAFVAAVVRRSWMESVFGLDIDHGSGLVEWALVAALFSITCALTASAHRQWRQCRA